MITQIAVLLNIARQLFFCSQMPIIGWHVFLLKNQETCEPERRDFYEENKYENGNRHYY